jgi:acetyltransferase
MLNEFFHPKSVAVIGASRTPGKVGHAVLSNLLSGGFQGRIVPVNPAAHEILGHPCHARPIDADTPVDLALVVVPVPQVPEAVEEAARAGARAICVITAGYKEAGEAGVLRERELAALCARLHVRLLGPNCLGLINTANGLNASFAHQMPPRGNISVISQSGALCTAILDLAMGRGFGLAKLISIGNKADLNETDFLRALGDDPETRVVVCYLEAITDGEAFIKAAEAVSAVKPVVILKAGITEEGARAASSHTGSLVGADIAYEAAFRRAGVVRAHTFDTLFDAAIAFSMQPLPPGDRVAIITNAGGPGILAADAVARLGMRVCTLSPEVEARLAAALPAAAHVGNPIDVLGDAKPDRYRLAITEVLGDEAVDAVLVILTPQAMTEPSATAEAIIACARGAAKPVMASFLGGRDIIPARREFVEAGLPDYASPERAAAALRAMMDYANWRRRPPRVVTRFPVNRHRVERIIGRHTRSGLRHAGEVDAKEILRAYDFNVLPGAVARSMEEAVHVADRIGYPVAMKIVSPEIIHKSDIGGVRLGLANADQVRDAYDLMLLRVGRSMPDATIEGAYVERMAKPGREVILGMHRDPQFGPMLMFGLGGIFVEVMKDVSFYLAPVTEEEALHMLESTRSYALLKGVRGELPVDLQAIAGCIQRISQLATDFPQIVEMDINPLIVREAGAPPTVADARMTFAGIEAPDVSHQRT